LRPVASSEIPSFEWRLFPRLLVLALSIGALVYRIVAGTTPSLAGLTGVVVLFVASFLVSEMRPTPRKFLDMLIQGGRDGVGLTVSCAGIGIIIGGISSTGLGIKFSQAIIGVGEANLALALTMAALCCLIIGMGLPTAASYLMVVFIAAPAITKLGLPLLAAHLFIFYYAVLSAITPPVAICAYAASGIAQSNALVTGVHAVRLGALGFLLPFLWMYNPELMLLGGGTLRTIWVILSCAVAVIALAGANIGFLRRRLAPWERIILIGVGAGIAFNHDLIRLAALLLGVTLFVFVLRSGLVKGEAA
jgi:TRAP-type uncharacterized transport system fused permease subunit